MQRGAVVFLFLVAFFSVSSPAFDIKHEPYVYEPDSVITSDSSGKILDAIYYRYNDSGFVEMKINLSTADTSIHHYVLDSSGYVLTVTDSAGRYTLRYSYADSMYLESISSCPFDGSECSPHKSFEYSMVNEIKKLTGINYFGAAADTVDHDTYSYYSGSIGSNSVSRIAHYGKNNDVLWSESFTYDGGAGLTVWQGLSNNHNGVSRGHYIFYNFEDLVRIEWQGQDGRICRKTILYYPDTTVPIGRSTAINLKKMPKGIPGTGIFFLNGRAFEGNPGSPRPASPLLFGNCIRSILE
jgi:hypothetical protein